MYQEIEKLRVLYNEKAKNVKEGKLTRAGERRVWGKKRRPSVCKDSSNLAPRCTCTLKTCHASVYCTCMLFF